METLDDAKCSRYRGVDWSALVAASSASVQIAGNRCLVFTAPPVGGGGFTLRASNEFALGSHLCAPT